MPQMIIASRLGDGAVVFLANDNTWTDSIDNGALVDSAPDTERLMAIAKEHEVNCIVTDPYPIDIEIHGRKRRPVSVREAIRAFGPTVRTYAAGDGQG